jgi:hypothetical protein
VDAKNMDDIPKHLEGLLSSTDSSIFDTAWEYTERTITLLIKASTAAIDILDAAPGVIQELRQKAEGSTREKICELILASASFAEFCKRNLLTEEQTQELLGWISQQYADIVAAQAEDSETLGKAEEEITDDWTDIAETPSGDETPSGEGAGNISEEWTDIAVDCEGTWKVAQEAMNTSAEGQEPVSRR